MLTVIDEFTRRWLAIVVARKLKSDDVLHCQDVNLLFLAGHGINFEQDFYFMPADADP